jgi:hypothetical protein
MSIYHMHGYGHPSKNRPQWYVGYMTFQAGIPALKRSSLTGSGQIYARDYPGKFPPVIVLQTSPTVSTTGGGILPQQMPFLQRLFANPSGQNTGS